MFVATSRAFGLWLDVGCIIYIAIVTFSFFVNGDAGGNNVGLAITQAISMTNTVQWGMRQSAVSIFFLVLFSFISFHFNST